MTLLEGGFDVTLPRFAVVRQRFPRPRVEDLTARVHEELARQEIAGTLTDATRVAVGVGSRGIADLAVIVPAVIESLKEHGCEPFIVPAMGSHGGASGEGQKEVLASYGIDEEACGAPVISSMETVEVGRTEDGLPIYFDRAAAEADAIVPINRVKPHTDFHGAIESGLLKMLVIGFGKHRGASTVHRQGMERFAEIIPSAGDRILAQLPVAFGVAIVENAYEETARVEAISSPEIRTREAELLTEARDLMARLPFDPIDVLLVSEMGKNISGSGMDPNVTGRYVARFMKRYEPEPQVQKIAVLDLTDATHGNACGIGAADVVSRRLVDRIDFQQTYANVITAAELGGGRIPVTLDTDREVLVVALRTLHRVEPGDARVVWIRNTLELEGIVVSEALIPDVEEDDTLEILEPPQPLTFADDDRLHFPEA